MPRNVPSQQPLGGGQSLLDFLLLKLATGFLDFGL
jgi:hypothetical protein